MQNTNEQETLVTQAEYVLSEIEEMEIISHIKTQQIQNRISRDETLMEKIDLLVSVLKSEALDNISMNLAGRKLDQLIKRL